MENIINAHTAVLSAIAENGDTAPHSESFNEAIKAQQAEHEAAIQEKAQSITALENEVAALKAERDDLDKSLTEANAAYATLRDEKTAEVEKLESEKAEMSDLIEASNAKIEELMNTNKAMAEQLEDTPKETVSAVTENDLEPPTDPIARAEFYINKHREN